MNAPVDPNTETHPIRTFMAVAISEAVRNRLTGVQARLKQSGADVGWVAPDKIHLTILFLGHVFESQASKLADAADTIAAFHRPFALEVKGIGYFGRPQSPKVIWAGLKGDLQPLQDMQYKIAEAAKQTGIFGDNKPFHPHLTIGRVRSMRNIGALPPALAAYQDTDFGTVEIDRVLLMKSDLTAQGPIYTLLHESRLA